MMKTLYLKYRNEFCNWLRKKYLVDADTAIEMYQESITTFFEKIKSGQQTTLDGDIKAYVFGIGKNKILQQRDQFAKSNRHAISLSEHLHFISQEEERSAIFDNAVDVTRQLMAEMGQPCQSLLYAFYFQHLSMDQIAVKFGYKTEGVARTTKKRCIQKIRELVFKGNQHG